MRKTVLFVAFFYMFCVTLLAENVQIVPQPVSVQEGQGTFHLSRSSKFFYHEATAGAKETTLLFVKQLMVETGLTLPIDTYTVMAEVPAGSLVISMTEAAGKYLNPEAYELNISEQGVTITASSPAGIFYAFQSVLQLLPKEVSAKRSGKRILLPSVLVYDYPRFGYRGMHLDVSRHFFPASFIKQYLDLLARYKLNTFHWHITDSHGWRLEIEKYPRLTSVGAWRAPRENIPMTISMPTLPGEPATYGGFYTRDEVKDIVAYARERFITVIPEIEMPGHSTAALVAYPAFTCLNNPVPLLMPTGYAGDLMHNFCPGYDSTFIFLNDVLEEVIDLFPSEYIHIGGDEVKGASWLSCPRCRKRMDENRYTSVRQLQAYFTARIDSFIVSRGRKSIGWDEILEAGNLSPNAAVMSWRGTAGGIEGAEKGHRVVMTPYRYTYFDFYQSAPALEPRITYAGLFLDSVYAFRPTAGLSVEAAKNVLGVQACLWTENISSEPQVLYMLLPRMLALAEVAWSGESERNYRNFINRVENEFKYFRKANINYAKSLYNVAFHPSFDTMLNIPVIRLSEQAGGKYQIRYTTNGTNPTAKSKLYTEPIPVVKTSQLSTALFGYGKQLGLINSETFSVHRAVGIKPVVSPGSSEVSFQKLTDGIHGTIEPYDGRWTIFRDSVITITIDLKSNIALKEIRFDMLEDKVGNAFLPGEISISISADGDQFSPIHQITNTKVPLLDWRHIVHFKKTLNGSARFIKMELKQSRQITAELPEKLLFLDEIVVE